MSNFWGSYPKETILGQIRTVYDHLDDAHEVIEEVERPGFGSYWRFGKGSVSKYTDPATGSEFDVPGIILSADKSVMRTDSLIVEALLGQAEALDDYSRGLQDERVKAQRLTNRRIGLDIKLEVMRQRIVEEGDRDAAEIYATLYHSLEPQEDDEEDEA